eukprot:SAG31_NODE_1314_length_8851_cov_7.233318_7_plen_110_part_00
MDEDLLSSASGTGTRVVELKKGGSCLQLGDPGESAQMQRNRLGLCLLNFLSADIRDGLGPFAAVYLLQVYYIDTLLCIVTVMAFKFVFAHPNVSYQRARSSRKQSGART